MKVSVYKLPECKRCMYIPTEYLLEQFAKVHEPYFIEEIDAEVVDDSGQDNEDTFVLFRTDVRCKRISK